MEIEIQEQIKPNQINLDSYLSTNARFRCVTTKIESPEQISLGLFKWPKLSHFQLMPSYTPLWHHSGVTKTSPYFKKGHQINFIYRGGGGWLPGQNLLRFVTDFMVWTPSNQFEENHF